MTVQQIAVGGQSHLAAETLVQHSLDLVNDGDATAPGFVEEEGKKRGLFLRRHILTPTSAQMVTVRLFLPALTNIPAAQLAGPADGDTYRFRGLLQINVKMEYVLML